VRIGIDIGITNIYDDNSPSAFIVTRAQTLTFTCGASTRFAA